MKDVRITVSSRLCGDVAAWLLAAQPHRLTLLGEDTTPRKHAAGRLLLKKATRKRESKHFVLVLSRALAESIGYWALPPVIIKGSAFTIYKGHPVAVRRFGLLCFAALRKRAGNPERFDTPEAIEGHLNSLVFGDERWKDRLRSRKRDKERARKRIREGHTLLTVPRSEKA